MSTKINNTEEKVEQKFRLKEIDKTRNYFSEDISFVRS